MGVEKSKHNSSKYFVLSKIKNKSLKKILKKKENIYKENGSFYLISPSSLKKNESFYAKKIIPLVCKSMIESIDIDTEDDWKIAKKVVNLKLN